MRWWRRKRYVHDARGHNVRAAREVVPHVMARLHPRSVVDVGCGTGTWLSVFAEHGLADYLGVEGPHLDPAMLVVPRERVHLADLDRPLVLDRQFDLVVSLEVAEHLPASSADVFVESLTRLGKVILFSAAIPRQGGQNHLNEQWPTYWEACFKRRGYHYSDTLRPVFWDNPAVDTYYKQNMFLVCHPSLAEAIPPTRTILNVVHPAAFLKARRKRFRKLSYDPAPRS